MVHTACTVRERRRLAPEPGAGENLVIPPKHLVEVAYLDASLELPKSQDSMPLCLSDNDLEATGNS